MAREDISDDLRPGQSLMDLHGCAARVGEDVGDTFALESFDEDIGTFSGLVRGVAGDKRLRRQRRTGSGGGGGCRF